MWDGEFQTTCYNTTPLWLAAGGTNLILDLLTFLLPLYNMTQLNISTSKKIGVCSTFAVGLFVTLVSAIRLQKVYVYRHSDSASPTRDFNNICIWSQAEMYVGIVCACMPSFARVCRTVWNTIAGGRPTKIYETTEGQKSQKYSGDQVEVRCRSLSSTVQTLPYGRGAGSTDEIELVASSARSMTGESLQHKYV